MSSRSSLLFSAVLLAVASCASAASLQFSNPFVISNAANLGLVAAADVNRDGKDDIITWYHTLCSVGDGTFTNTFFSTEAVTSAVMDCNGDGKLDLIRRMSIWLGDGAGNFTFHTNLVPPEQIGTTSPLYVTGADFNRDGKQDLCFGFDYTSGPQSHFDVWTNVGSGVFVKVLPTNTIPNNGASPVPPTQITAADFDQDGSPDVAVSLYLYSTNGLRIYRGKGDGTFYTPSEHAPFTVMTDYPAHLVADLNTDGFPDILAFGAYQNTVSFLPGNASNTIGSPVRSSRDFWRSSYVRDLDGDGHLDLFTFAPGNPTGAGIWFSRGDGTGRFEFGNFIPLFTNYMGGSVLCGDFNADGKPDLALRGGDGNLYTFLNETPGTTNRPALSARNGPDAKVVHWPRIGFGFFRLQSTTNLAATTGWEDMQNVIAHGSDNFVTNDVTSTRFFRLRQD